AIFLKGKLTETDSVLLGKLKRGYQRLLQLSLRYTAVFITAAVALLLVLFWQGSKLGSEFMPQLDEGDIALHAMRIPGTSLTQSLQMQLLLEREILILPQVERVFSKIGTAEIATDPMPPNVADTFVILKPRSEWPQPQQTK